MKETSEILKIILDFADDFQRVQPSDRGWYMCQVNTDPMVQRSGYFEVVGKSSEVRTNVLETNKNESTLFPAGEFRAQGI